MYYDCSATFINKKIMRERDVYSENDDNKLYVSYMLIDKLARLYVEGW